MLVLALGCAKSVSFDIDLPLFEHADPAEPVEPVSWDLDLFDERATAYLPAFVDVDDFGALLLADAVLREDGAGFLTAAVDELLVEVDGPLTLAVTVSSADGRRYLVRPGAEVVSPPECTLVADASTTAEAHAADLLACLRAWTDANGGPVDLFVELAASTADDDWSYAASWTFGADRPVIAQCTGQQVVDGELGEEADGVVIEELELAGYAASAQERLSVVAFAGTWSSPEALASAGASASLTVEAGEGAVVGRPIEVLEPVPDSIVFRDGAEPSRTFPADWAELAADDLRADGFVEACVVEVPDALPADTWTHVALVGEGTAER